MVRSVLQHRDRADLGGDLLGCICRSSPNGCTPTFYGTSKLASAAAAAAAAAADNATPTIVICHADHHLGVDLTPCAEFTSETPLKPPMLASM